MRRYLLLLFISLACGQGKVDKLILRNGIEYLGKFEKEEEGIIFFKPVGEFSFQPIEESKVDTIIIASENNLENTTNRSILTYIVGCTTLYLVVLFIGLSLGVGVPPG
tara:strand:- start:1808 stop:2131 length:324 start_codon:yes stop_codon:yes gene_type:complete